MDDSHPRARDAADFLRGDSGAVEHVRRSIRAVVAAFQTPAGARDDLVQETLTRVFLNVSGGRFRGAASLATYAQNVARYVCLEHLRRRRFDSEIDPDTLPSRSSWSGPEETLLRAETHRANLALLAGLTPECRELFRLIFLEELSYRQVAERLGISETGVKSRVHRCRPDRGAPGPALSAAGARGPFSHWRPVKRVHE